MIVLLVFVEVAFSHSVWTRLYVSTFACAAMYLCLHSYNERAELSRESLVYQDLKRLVVCGIGMPHPLRHIEGALCVLYHLQTCGVHAARPLSSRCASASHGSPLARRCGTRARGARLSRSSRTRTASGCCSRSAR